MTKQPDYMAPGLNYSETAETPHRSQPSKDHEPAKRLFKGREFELRFTSNNNNVAKREAKKSRKRGFHTRLVESSPGVFSVYRRLKTTH